ncbi:MAG: glycosyltransferase [Thermoanaerobaculia bacterium]
MWKRVAGSPRADVSMRILWPHNFNPAQPNSQVFMNIAAAGLRARGVDLRCEYLGNLRSVGNLVRARKRIRDMAGDFDLVHAQYGSACGLAAAAAGDVPKVLSIRGNDWSVYDQSVNFHYFHTRLARFMTRRSIGAYDLIVTVSRRVAGEIQRFAPGASVMAMPSPIDLNRFLPLDKREARARLGFPGNEERWVLFNALNLDDPVKRFALARKAFDLANERLGNLRLRIATKLPHADLPLFTAACDVILCTSETEGWPNCVKEALACNVPFVATDVSDLHEIAAADPHCRVCPDDPQVLADSLCEVLTSREKPDVRKYVEGMRVEVLSDQLVGAYESLVGRKAAARGAAREI